MSAPLNLWDQRVSEVGTGLQARVVDVELCPAP
jgi:hypothetical protein